MHTRRTMLALGAASVASSCAAARGFGEGLQQDLGRGPRVRRRLAPVLAARERVIRVDVGLRPYRPSGFRVAREALGEKTIVHNYGHGGGGITLSWGTSKLALDQGFDPAQRDYAVIGCGAVGLATARLLQERGARVRIYAKAMPPDVTSNVAGAQWWPASVFEGAPSEAFREQFVEACRFANRRFQSLTGDEYGVGWETNYYISARPITTYPTSPTSPIRDLAFNQHDLEPGEHPFDAPYARRFDTMMIETPQYLRRMVEDVRIAGGEIVAREFQHVSELLALPERTIFNCSGLGAGALFGDSEIRPARGQLVILLPQAEVDYNVIADGGLYMFGRRDGIVLGGTFEQNQWDLSPTDAAIDRILSGHQRIFNAVARAR
ncbi:MAG: FAD-dependent oxidoreductase [Hyphomonadaceae bacterium]|nr:FAD-dependent oxidoreductase [Hyphomonadaceae bacterium]